CIDVQNDALWYRNMLQQESIDEKVFDLVGVGDDLLVAAVRVGADRREFETVERALARQGFASITCKQPLLAKRILLAHQHGQQRIVPQAVVVEQIAITQTHAEE